MAPMEVDQPPAKGVGLSAAAALCMEGDNTPSDWHLRSLLKQLTACLDSKPTEKPAEHYGKRGEGHGSSGSVTVLPRLLYPPMQTTPRTLLPHLSSGSANG